MNQNLPKRNVSSIADQFKLVMNDDPNITREELIALIKDPSVKPRIKKRKNNIEMHFYILNGYIVALQHTFIQDIQTYHLCNSVPLIDLEDSILDQLEDKVENTKSTYMEIKIPRTHLAVRVSYKSIKQILTIIRKTSIRSIVVYIFKKSFLED